MSGKLPYNWLITGGCGFIGSNLIRNMIDSGVAPEQITVLDNFSGLKSDTLMSKFGSGVNVVQGDVRDLEIVNQTLKNIDTVIHLAASTSVDLSVAEPHLDFHHNATGTLNVLQSCCINAVKRFVFASSSAVLGEAEPPIHENLAPRPISPYGASKLAGEAYCSAFTHSYGLETVCLRFANVYGPGAANSRAIVPNFIASALSGAPLTINGDGSATRDYVYVDDLCEAIISAATKTVPKSAVYQIASNSETTVKEMFDLIVAIVKQKTGQKVSFIHGSKRQGDIERSFSDISRAKAELGWTPRTPLETGMAQTISWFITEMSEGRRVR